MQASISEHSLSPCKNSIFFFCFASIFYLQTLNWFPLPFYPNQQFYWGLNVRAVIIFYLGIGIMDNLSWRLNCSFAHMTQVSCVWNFPFVSLQLKRMWVSQYVAILILITVVLSSKNIYTTRDQGPPTFHVFYLCSQNGYILVINK